MANLLPTTERATLLKRRRQQLAIVSFILVVGSVALALALLIPSIITALANKRASNERLLATQKLIELQKEAGISDTLADARDEITLLKATLAKDSAFENVSELVELIPGGVTVRFISFTRKESGTEISFTGIASTRNTLISFGNSLRQSGLFSSVLIPLPTLAQNTDIEFNLKLTLVPQDSLSE